MLLIVDSTNRALEHKAMRSMFEARKRVFIDLLKWDLPALADRFELDHFDDVDATYLIVTDTAGEHLASARLLLTTRPALLDSLFPELVAGTVPQGKDVLEITRFCLSPGIGSRQRRIARDALLVGLAEFALENAIRTYTGVAELSWFRQVQTFGWECRALGEPVLHRGQALVALRRGAAVDQRAVEQRLREVGLAIDEDSMLPFGFFGAGYEVARRSFANN